ncbi:class I SAM-dependent methyltransferase [Rhodanobacter ginsengisoli]|uniref:Class I SAM-dependent methyltransferase n=1 Tax=Rhodanobacter ginsengisoli TaxID=418646 RepID=A0ABW0QPF1_9GAMM
MNPEAYLEMASTESRHWWFAARREILSRIIEGLALPPSARILEAGSGTGGNLMMLSAYGLVSAIEMDEGACAVSRLKTEGRFVIRQGCFPDDVPYEGETFDLIFMADVLEHVERNVETLVALRRMLAPGGRMLITVPAYQWLWSPHDVFLQHTRRYTSKSLRQVLMQAGLRVDRLSYFNALLLPLAILARVKDRMMWGGKSSGTTTPPALVNRTLFSIFRSERRLLGRFNLPAGVSVLAIARAE